MDRNISRASNPPSAVTVALLAEGVDRNISDTIDAFQDVGVALLAEGVDRNTFNEALGKKPPGSPSSRRAWIEISTTGT